MNNSAPAMIDTGLGGPVRRTRRAARTIALRDETRVKKASLSVGVAVAIAAGAVVLILALILIALALTQSVQTAQIIQNIPGDWNRPVLLPGPVHGPRGGWISADQLIWAVAILAVVSVGLTGVVGWWASKRAVKPLADALQLQRHFVADASHELRTPLTALSSRVQILQRRLAAGKDVESVIAQLQTDADAMAHTLNDLLLTAEGGAPVESAASVGQAVESAVSSLAALAEEGGVRCVTDADGDPMVAAPFTSLTRAIVAVVDNAIQHSPDGGVVTVSAHVEGAMAVIRVADQGPGIVGVDPAQIFERFAHGSETGKRRSFGLGLALASEVAHRFGGDIGVESTGPQGTVFALSFPNITR